MLPIILGVARVSAGERAHSFYATPVDETSARTSIFKRDEYRCGFCGFAARKYQQLHFINGERRDWRSENLITACIFCEQCFALDHVARMQSGSLIWLPELSQAAINHIVRAIFVAKVGTGRIAEAATSAFRALEDRREDAKRRIGTDEPGTLSAVFKDYLEDQDYERRAGKLEGLRILPRDRRIIHEGDIEFNQFPQILTYWRSKDGPFHGALPATWEQSFAELANARPEVH